jgi:hypothetical protein
VHPQAVVEAVGLVAVTLGPFVGDEIPREAVSVDERTNRNTTKHSPAKAAAFLQQ